MLAEISALPLLEPEIVSKKIGAVEPPFAPPAPPIPFLTTFLMDITPKLVHNVQVSWSLLPWETALVGVLDVEVSCVLPSFMGSISNNFNLAGSEVLRDVSKSFSASPLGSVTVPFPWKVTGWDLVWSIWGWLTTGKVLVRCWGSLGEFVFTKDFTVEAWVPVK